MDLNNLIDLPISLLFHDISSKTFTRNAILISFLLPTDQLEVIYDQLKSDRIGFLKVVVRQ